MKNSLHGIYPGKLKYDVKYIENCSEIELFNQVNKYYNYLNNESNNDKDRIEYEYAFEFCILKTERFNTNVLYNPNGHVIITEEFQNWFNNWQIYVSTMDEETLMAYRKYQYEGKQLETFKLDNSVITKPHSIEDYTNKTIKKSIKQISA